MTRMQSDFAALSSGKTWYSIRRVNKSELSMLMQMANRLTLIPLADSMHLEPMQFSQRYSSKAITGKREPTKTGVPPSIYGPL